MFQNNSDESESEDEYGFENDGSNIWASLALLAIGAIGGGIIAYLFSKDESPNVEEPEEEYDNPARDIPIAPPDECSICLGEISPGMETLPCNHMFHKGCILDWFNARNSQSGKLNTDCPTCRNNLTPQQINKYKNR